MHSSKMVPELEDERAEIERKLSDAEKKEGMEAGIKADNGGVNNRYYDDETKCPMKSCKCSLDSNREFVRCKYCMFWNN